MKISFASESKVDFNTFVDHLDRSSHISIHDTEVPKREYGLRQLGLLVMYSAEKTPVLIPSKEMRRDFGPNTFTMLFRYNLSAQPKEVPIKIDFLAETYQTLQDATLNGDTDHVLWNPARKFQMFYAYDGNQLYQNL